MDIMKELEFLKKVTLGLFNKKGVSFALNVQPSRENGRYFDILIVNDPTTTSGNVLRLKITYSTVSDNVRVNLEVNSHGFEFESYKVGEWVDKEGMETYLTNLLHEAKEKADNAFSEEDDAVDFYGILEQLSDDMFFTPDLFEFNGWKQEIYLHEDLGKKFPEYDIPYQSLVNVFHVHGGVGRVQRMADLHAITTSIELGTLPQNNKVYLDVHSTIAKDSTIPKGLYEDSSIEQFIQAVVEQYKGAWNKE